MNSIAHYINTYLGISESFIYQVINNHKNWYPIIFTKKIVNIDQFPFKNIISSDNIKRYSSWWFKNYIDYYLLEKQNFFEYLSFFKYHMKKYNIRLIHAHFGPSGVDMVLIKNSLKIPLITTFYGYDMSELPKQKVWMDRYKKLFRTCDLFLVEGPHMKKKLAEIGCPSNKIKIQKISIDLDKIPFKERRLKNNEKVKLLFCGRFVEKKGLIYALKAIKNVYQDFPNIEFRIIGDGILKPQILQYIKENNMEKYTTLLGYQPYQRILQEMQNSHILLQPSITAQNGDSEGGAPTVLLEAQASGMPVISTYHADIPNVIIDGKTGYLVQEGNVKELSNTIFALIEQNKNWKDFGIQGRSFINRNHNIKKNINKLENLYRKLI